MAVIHIPQQRRFTAVSNELARSRNVSLPAKGLMLYLLSHTDNWQVTAHDIETTHNIGRDARQRLYRELETAGYLSARRTQNEKGHWSFDIDAHEEPLAPENRTSLLGATKPEVLNRVPGNPVAGDTGGRETRSYTKDQIVPNTDLRNTDNTSPADAGREPASVPGKEKKNSPCVGKGTACRKPELFADIFEQAHLAKYGLPSSQAQGGFVQLSKLKARLGDLLTENEWRKAVGNFFASPLSKHELTHLTTSYASFRCHALDRFGKPVDSVPTAPTTVNGVRIDPSLTAHDLELVNGRPRIGWQRQWDRFPTARKTPEMAAEWMARYGIRTGAKVA